MIISIGVFMSTLDSSIVSIANPTIAKSFSVTMQEVQWVITAYILVIASTLIALGKLGDKYGSTKIFSLGFLIFALGSLFCSLSFNLSALVGARLVQALGGSMMMATGLGIISHAFPSYERGIAFGITGSAVGLGQMAGPSIGGLLLTYFNWPIIFLINVPIGFIGFLISIRCLEKVNSQQIEKIKALNIILFAMAISFLILALSPNISMRSGLFILGASLLIVFYHVEKKGRSTILDFDLFTIKPFVYGCLMASCAYFAQTSVIFLMPFYFENLLQLTPGQSGIFMTLLPVCLVITSPLAGKLSDQYGPGAITTIAFLLMLVSFLLLATLNQILNPAKIISGLVFLGVGMGLFGSPNNSSILGSLPQEKVGYGGGFISTIRNVSFSFGIAISVSLFSFLQNHYYSYHDFTVAYYLALNKVYLLAAGISIIGLILSLYSYSFRKKI